MYFFCYFIHNVLYSNTDKTFPCLTLSFISYLLFDSELCSDFCPVFIFSHHFQFFQISYSFSLCTVWHRPKPCHRLFVHLKRLHKLFFSASNLSYYFLHDYSVIHCNIAPSLSFRDMYVLLYSSVKDSFIYIIKIAGKCYSSLIATLSVDSFSLFLWIYFIASHGIYIPCFGSAPMKISLGISFGPKPFCFLFCVLLHSLRFMLFFLVDSLYFWSSGSCLEMVFEVFSHVLRCFFCVC